MGSHIDLGSGTEAFALELDKEFISKLQAWCESHPSVIKKEISEKAVLKMLDALGETSQALAFVTTRSEGNGAGVALVAGMMYFLNLFAMKENHGDDKIATIEEAVYKFSELMWARMQEVKVKKP